MSKNNPFESFVAPKDKFPVIKRSHPIAPTFGYTGRVAVYNGVFPRDSSISDRSIHTRGDLNLVELWERSGHRNSGNGHGLQWIHKQVVDPFRIVILECCDCSCDELGFGILGIKVRLDPLDEE